MQPMSVTASRGELHSSPKNDRASKRAKNDATQSQSSKVRKKMHVNAVMRCELAHHTHP